MSPIKSWKRLEEAPPTHPLAGRLGRHPQWDKRNEDHLVRMVTKPKPSGKLAPKVWTRTLGPLDQGDVGACTIYGLVGALRTKPITGTLTSHARRLLSDPVALYSEETVADDFPGSYPPDDTGSSVLAAMKLAKAKGFIKGYKWATNGDEAATALATLGPAEVGFNWHEGMDNPDAYGVVVPTGAVRGGHAFEALGRVWDVDTWYWIFINSWGTGWPAKPNLGKPGRFAMREADVFALIEADGEVAVPTLKP